MADINDKAKKPSNDKQKPLRKSTRLQERVAQQNLADNLPAVSQPAQSEPLDYRKTTIIVVYWYTIFVLNLNTVFKHTFT